jgi:PAS domain S-box-containing protein
MQRQDTRPLRLLLVEDSEDDVELLVRELYQGGFAPSYKQVDSAEAMRQALAEQPWDAIISDYVLPGFGAVEAFDIAQEHDRDMPFIIVSGKVADEIIVELVRAGAHDYVLKDNLVRLAPAMRRELDEAALRRERREIDAALRRSYNELEVRVRERTAELAEANATLQVEIAQGERQKLQLAQRVEELATLYEVSQAILATTGAEETARRVCEMVVERFGLRMACVGTIHDAQDAKRKLIPLTAVGFGSHWLEDLSIDLLDESRSQSPMVRAIRSRQPLVINQIAADPTLDEAYRETALERGYRSLVVLPMVIDDYADGVLVAYASIEDAFGKRRTQTLQSATNLMRLAMFKSELLKRVEDHAEMLEQEVRGRTRALQQSEARWRAIFEEASIGVALLDDQGQLLSANPALAAMIGQAHERLPRSLDDFLKLEDGVGHADCLANVLKQEALPYRAEATGVDGQDRWFRVSLSSLSSIDHDDELYLALIQDITEEREATAARLRLERMAATGRLVAILAHEINNPLQGVIGCLGLADEVLAEGKDVSNYLKIANEEALRIVRLVISLRELYHQQNEQREKVDLQALIQRVLDLLDPQLSAAHIQVQVTADGEDLTVLTLPDHIRQVFVNLSLNAVDAMPDGGQLSVHLSPTIAPSGVKVSLADTGSGISPEVMRQLFDPFVTTKTNGIGLGLYTCRTILDQHGGWIDLQSEEGQGTTVTVWLPEA